MQDILITFFLSLTVALIAILVDRKISDRKGFHKMLKNISFEISENTEIAESLLPMIAENIELARQKQQETAFPIVPFYDFAWVNAKNSGQLDCVQNSLIRELSLTYFDVHAVNGMTNTRERLKVSSLFVTAEYREIHLHYLEAIEDFVKNKLIRI